VRAQNQSFGLPKLAACVATIWRGGGHVGRALSSSTLRADLEQFDGPHAGWLVVMRSLAALSQFVLLQWYFRFIVWNEFLWEVSRLRLQLMPTHPDRRGGLGFLFALNDLLAPFLLAHGTMLAGRVANVVIHAGLTVRDYEV
jgi:hypothetical protein